MFKKLLISLFKWVFKEKLFELDTKISEASDITRRCIIHERKLKHFMDNIDVSVDVYEDCHTPSWAVVSIQGESADFIKFINLGRSDIISIHRFLSHFDRRNRKVDASPRASKFLKIHSR